MGLVLRKVFRFLQEQQKIAHYIQASGFEYNDSGRWEIEEFEDGSGVYTKYVCLVSNDDTSVQYEVTDTGYFVEVNDESGETLLEWNLKAFYQLLNFVEMSLEGIKKEIEFAKNNS